MAAQTAVGAGGSDEAVAGAGLAAGEAGSPQRRYAARRRLTAAARPGRAQGGRSARRAARRDRRPAGVGIKPLEPAVMPAVAEQAGLRPQTAGCANWRGLQKVRRT